MTQATHKSSIPRELLAVGGAGKVNDFLPSETLSFEIAVK